MILGIVSAMGVPGASLLLFCFSFYRLALLILSAALGLGAETQLSEPHT